MENSFHTSAAFVWRDLEAIRRRAPLVHNITNYVVMNTTANALLALGASPVMAHAEEEVEEMAALAGALVVNIGTLSASWIRAMFKAESAACRAARPIVLDPVGAGATEFRTRTALDLLEHTSPQIIRGNASEILALHRAGERTKGVDSTLSSDQALDAARYLAQRFHCVVVVSGVVDLIVTESALARIANGHPLMPKVTGLGCTATAFSAAFAAINTSPFHAAVHAMAVMGIAGEIAGEQAKGPGSFWVHFLDTLYLLGESDLRTRLKLQESPT